MVGGSSTSLDVTALWAQIQASKCRGVKACLKQKKQEYVDIKVVHQELIPAAQHAILSLPCSAITIL